MVNLSSWGFLALVLISQDPSSSPSAEETSRAVRQAMGKANYPWYDAKADAPRTFQPRPDPTVSQASSSSGNSSASGSLGFLGFLGNTITMIFFGIALAALVAILVWFWKVYEPSDLERTVREPKKSGDPSHIEVLPGGIGKEFVSSDPWSEAIRLRNQGDLAGAIICLFAHQLLTLSRLGLVRLAPGRTGRQLLRAVADAEFRTMVNPTLRLFEIVCYGQRSPTESEFTVVWNGAESFERKVAGVSR